MFNFIATINAILCLKEFWDYCLPVSRFFNLFSFLSYGNNACNWFFLSPTNGFWSNIELRNLKQNSIVLNGPREKVNIYIDNRRVPHIFAKMTKTSILLKVIWLLKNGCGKWILFHMLQPEE